MIISLSLSFLFIIIFLCQKYARMLIEYKYLLIEVIKLVREKEKKNGTQIKLKYYVYVFALIKILIFFDSCLSIVNIN